MQLTYLLLAAASGLVPRAAAQCFHIDGSSVTDQGVAPCLGSSSASSGNASAASMCCNVNRQAGQVRRDDSSSSSSSSTNNAVGSSSGQLQFTGPDVCLDNGLCQSQLVDGQGRTQTQFSRDSCSRSDWVGCLKSVCSTVTGDNAPMTPCGITNQTTQWCCGSNNVACCALWPDHPDAASVPLDFSINAAEAPKGVAPGPVSIGPGGTLSLSTAVQTGTGGLGGAPTSAGGRNGASPPITTRATATITSGTALGLQTVSNAAAATSNGSDPSDNGEALVTGTTGLSTQEVAAIVAGIVVIVVVLVSIGCFTAESMYKKRQLQIQARRRDALKQNFPLGPKSRPLM